MIDPYNDIISKIVQKKLEEQEKILRRAFQRHFGFTFEEADKTKLDRLIVHNSPLQQFRYNGETFLLWDESSAPEYHIGTNEVSITYSQKYLEV